MELVFEARKSEEPQSAGALTGQPGCWEQGEASPLALASRYFHELMKALEQACGHAALKYQFHAEGQLAMTPSGVGYLAVTLYFEIRVATLELLAWVREELTGLYHRALRPRGITARGLLRELVGAPPPAVAHP